MLYACLAEKYRECSGVEPLRDDIGEGQCASIGGDV